jgi:hypothetical protein
MALAKVLLPALKTSGDGRRAERAARLNVQLNERAAPSGSIEF